MSEENLTEVVIPSILDHLMNSHVYNDEDYQKVTNDYLAWVSKEYWTLSEASCLLLGEDPAILSDRVSASVIELLDDNNIEGCPYKNGIDFSNFLLKLKAVENFLCYSLPKSCVWRANPEVVLKYVYNSYFRIPSELLSAFKKSKMELHYDRSYAKLLILLYQFIASKEMLSFEDSLALIMGDLPFSTGQEAIEILPLGEKVGEKEFGIFFKSNYSNYFYKRVQYSRAKYFDKVKTAMLIDIESGEIKHYEIKKRFPSEILFRFYEVIKWAYEKGFYIHPVLLDFLNIEVLHTGKSMPNEKIIFAIEKDCAAWLRERMKAGGPKAPKISSKGRPDYFTAAITLFPQLRINQFKRAWTEASKDYPAWKKPGNKTSLIESIDELIQQN